MLLSRPQSQVSQVFMLFHSISGYIMAGWPALCFKSTACEAMPNTAFRNTCHIYTVQKSFTQRRHSEGFHTQRARRKHFFAANCEFCLFCCTFLMSSMAAASTELSTGCQKIYIKKKLFSRALVDMYTSEEFIYF